MTADTPVGTSSTALSHRPPKESRLALDGWVWIAVIATSPIQQLLYDSVSSEVRFVPLVVAVASLLLLRVKRVPGQGTLIIAAFAIVLAGFISGTNSSVTASAAVGVAFALLIAIVPNAIAFQVAHNASFVRNLVRAFLLVQTFSAIAAVVQMMGGTTLNIVSIAGRARGFAGHPNILGIMSVIAILLLLDLWRRRILRPVLIVPLLLIHSVVIAGSASLSSMLMLAVGLAFYAISLQGAVRYVLFTLLSVALAAAVAASSGDPTALLPDALEARISQVTEIDGERASWNIRLGTYEFALRSIASDPWIGVGMDSMNQSTTQPGLAVHNYLLRGWFQGGLLLLLAFVMITVILSISAARHIKETGIVAPAAILISMLVFGMTSALYTQSHYWMILLAPFVVMGGLRPRKVNRLSTNQV